MTKFLTAAAVAALALAPVACSKSPEGGGSGKDQGFSLMQVGGETNVPANGAEKTIKVDIKRESGFNGDPVELKAEVQGDSKGITAEFANSKADKDVKEVELRVKADKDTTRGKRTIKVTGTPKAGAATSFDVKIDVVNP